MLGFNPVNVLELVVTGYSLPSNSTSYPVAPFTAFQFKVVESSVDCVLMLLGAAGRTGSVVMDCCVP